MTQICSVPQVLYLDFDRTLSSEDMQKFFVRFINADGPELFYSDVEAFLQQLQKHSIPYLVLTYGVSPAWQELKVKASGYVGDYTIMDHADKGEVIAGMTSEEGMYQMPDENGVTYQAATACLIDDKAVAFTSLPKNCSGFMIQRNQTLLPSQQGALPPHVKRIQSLSELTIDASQVT